MIDNQQRPFEFFDAESIIYGRYHLTIEKENEEKEQIKEEFEKEKGYYF